MLVCPVCGLAHEVFDDELSTLAPLIAQETTELAVVGDVHYLAVWRLLVDILEQDNAVWEQIVRQASPALPYLYVPAFSSGRSVLQRLGFKLTKRQPVLKPLAKGRLLGRLRSQSLLSSDSMSGVADADDGLTGDESGFDLFSPVLIGRQDSRVLAHFVYQVLRSGESRDLSVVDYRLDVVAEELVFVPAVWDPRCIRDANWRLLLVEFDDLVA